ARFLEHTGADEVMATTQMHEPAAVLRSYEILAAVRDQLAAGAQRFSRRRAWR
ncbi:MAG: hypothetical protein ABEJ96_00250, partial [Thiohalorhabdaceae bacterium]